MFRTFSNRNQNSLLNRFYFYNLTSCTMALYIRCVVFDIDCLQANDEVQISFIVYVAVSTVYGGNGEHNGTVL